MAEARIDKWLWAVRIYKTRTIAANACKKGRVAVNDNTAKPARLIEPDDIISVRKPPVTYKFRVLQAIDKRVGAKLVPKMLENITPPEEYEILEMAKIGGFVDRARGSGRPTKRERRQLEEFTDPFFMDDDYDFE